MSASKILAVTAQNHSTSTLIYAGISTEGKCMLKLILFKTDVKISLINLEMNCQNWGQFLCLAQRWLYYFSFIINVNTLLTLSSNFLTDTRCLNPCILEVVKIFFNEVINTTVKSFKSVDSNNLQ